MIVGRKTRAAGAPEPARPRERRRGMRPRRGGWRTSTLVVLGLLLAVPGYALSRLSHHVDWRLLLGLPLAMSVFAFFAYRIDKRLAEAREWRIPEATLHFLALIGGWPGAFLAQRVFRHKTSKLSFQVVFWIVVGLHQIAAVNFIMD